MAAPDLQSLTARAEAIHERYRREFSGRSRATRDAGALDGMLAELQQVAAAADGAAGADALLSTIEERQQLYRTEREAIRDVQAEGPDAVVAARLTSWTWLALRRYHRGFAGQRRATRDLGLLEELTGLQHGWREAFGRLAVNREGGPWADTLGQMTASIDLFTKEAQAVRDSRASLDPGERARVMATLANDQFNVYRRHFEGKSRRTRRLELLHRVNRSLREVLRGMEAARQGGVQTEAHKGNIERVRARIEMYDAEIEKIRAARATISPADLAGALGDEANQLFKAYRDGFAGVARREADVGKLDDILEQLFDLALQMSELDARNQMPGNARNLDVVLDNTKQFERERQRIVDARKG